jgi:hypothetical protein
MQIYEYRPKEIEELLAFRNSMFTPVTPAQWRAMDCTGIVAREVDQLVGFIPLQYRQQCLNARISVPVVYENAVGVAEGKRGQGIGTKMIDAGAAFIADRADLMLVVRGGERSQGYRFYRKSGHSDLMYAWCTILSPRSFGLSQMRPGSPRSGGSSGSSWSRNCLTSTNDSTASMAGDGSAVLGTGAGYWMDTSMFVLCGGL